MVTSSWLASSDDHVPSSQSLSRSLSPKSLFQSQFSRQCNLVLHLSTSSTCSLPSSHPTAAYILFLIFPSLPSFLLHRQSKNSNGVDLMCTVHRLYQHAFHFQTITVSRWMNKFNLTYSQQYYLWMCYMCWATTTEYGNPVIWTGVSVGLWIPRNFLLTLKVMWRRHTHRIQHVLYFRVLPRSRWELRSTRLLCSKQW
jgi:hypothetical protein